MEGARSNFIEDESERKERPNKGCGTSLIRGFQERKTCLYKRKKERFKKDIREPLPNGNQASSITK